MQSFRNRLRLLVERSRRRPQRLRVPVEALPGDQDYIPRDGHVGVCYSHDVRGFVYRHPGRAPGRPRSGSSEGAWTVGGPVTRVVSRLGPAGEGGHNETSA